MPKIVYTHLYNIFVSLLLKCGLDLSRRRNFISENMATYSLIATGLIFYEHRPMGTRLVPIDGCPIFKWVTACTVTWLNDRVPG